MFSFGQVVIAQNPQVQPILQQKKEKPAKEQLAREYYRNKDYAKAVELFSQLYDESPSNQYYIYYFNCLLYLKDYKTAEKLVKKQQKLSSLVKYEIDLAYVYDLQGESRKAQSIIQKLLNNVPDNPNQIRQLAIQLQSKGYYNQALQVYTTAQNMGSGYKYYLEMAKVYQYSGEYEKMFDAYLMHIGNNPADMQTVKNRLQNITRIDVDNNLSETLRNKLLERAQSEPDNIVYAEMLMWYSLQIKDFDMAFRQARAMDMRFGYHDEEMLSLAEIALANKNFEIAGKSYNYIREKKFNTPFYLESYIGYYNAQVQKATANPMRNDILKHPAISTTNEISFRRIVVKWCCQLPSRSHLNYRNPLKINGSCGWIRAAKGLIFSILPLFFQTASACSPTPRTRSILLFHAQFHAQFGENLSGNPIIHQHRTPCETGPEISAPATSR